MMSGEWRRTTDYERFRSPLPFEKVTRPAWAVLRKKPLRSGIICLSLSLPMGSVLERRLALTITALLLAGIPALSAPVWLGPDGRIKSRITKGRSVPGRKVTETSL